MDCRDLAEQEARAKQLAAIVLTTSIDVPNRKVESVISIIAAEAALGMNIFRDIANNWRDFVGGRSNSSQKSLREARLACLEELRREAAAVGADAVIAVDLDYNELSTSGSGGILFVAASGTAVKLAPI
ncbi:YbjQ family protein [Rhizobium sp. WYCCWR 11146]|nr:YbjQ family protein [Rhizobium sp. WYCCWR 11146]